MSHNSSQFLHERNPELHSSREVEDVVEYMNNAVRDNMQQNPEARQRTIPNKPADKITAYLGFLADPERVNDGVLTGDQASIDRQIEAHVIKAEDVPEGYFELQRRIAREQGHGDIEIYPEVRSQMVEAVQADQRAGLGKWIEYLGGEDGSYPNWFKHYVFESVVKLGNYDKEKGVFLRRSKGTTAPYPELNREALAYVYDALNKSKIQGEPVEAAEGDEQLQKLLKNGNFGKLYAHAVLKAAPSSPELRRQTKGSWTKFDQTTDPRIARRLAGSLQGHGTDWCTAGESTAHTQLSAGDFYVYYTRDEDGKDTVPRVAIRMQEGMVAEVRGVNPAQELEAEMADITAERLKNLEGGDAYIRKAADMKRLTAIEQMTTDQPDVELSQVDLRFLYELDHDIQGFGYERDPRIGEIRALRGERDKPELARMLPEAIREQLKNAVAGYANVAESLGLGSRQRRFRKSEGILSAAEVSRLFEQKDREWRANGIYEYLVEQLITTGARYNLVATPNTAASEKQIVALAEKFGEDQPYRTYVYNNLYREGRYSASEWSGNQGAEAVRFSLIPTTYDKELGIKSAQQQVALLRQRQAKQPRFNFRVPSVLEAITYWYTLRAGGDKLTDGTAFDKTYIRHFDMEPKQVGGWRLVPYSVVRRDGRPELDYGAAEDGGDARVAVG